MSSLRLLNEIRTSHAECSNIHSQYLLKVLEKEMASHSSILAWRIPWTVESGGLQSIGSQTIVHN